MRHEAHNDTATKQAVTDRNSRGRFVPGNKPAVGFHTHPERRGDGRWNKEGSISYQYNILLRMSADEFEQFIPETVAQQIAYTRTKQAMSDDRLGLLNTIEITDRTEGKAKQDFGLSVEESSVPLLKGFVIPTLPEDFISVEV